MVSDVGSLGDAETPIWLKKHEELTEEERSRYAREQRPCNSPALKEVLEKHLKWVNSNGREGARINLGGQQIQAIGLLEANLDGAHADLASFKNGEFLQADFSGSDMRDSKLRHVRITGSDLSGTDFSRARGGKGR